AASRWTVVIPCYNEQAFIGATLASLAAQTERFALVVVDNGSTDASAAVVRAWGATQPHIDLRLIDEPTPGQVHALRTGLLAVHTELVAVCDADTQYPPNYLARAAALFDARGPGTVAVLAHDAVAGGEAALAARARRWLYSTIIPNLLSGQAHAGGYAHCYRTASLAAAGGYDAAIWPYVVKDHELAHRLLKQGGIAYAPDHWCVPSLRRADRKGVRWTLFERIVYHATPFALKDWFFYGFLGPRLAARKQTDVVLRQQSWAATP
ncbi:MAG: glycosyltransferase family 2 protein, partial [Polymorphobacter sp.]